MNNMHTKFSKSLTWNTVESLIYNGMMMAHQWALLEYTTLEMLGLIGTLFSCVFLTTALIDLGFEASLAPFFFMWSSSKKSFRSFFARQLIPNFIAGGLIVGSAFYANQLLGFTFPILVHVNSFTLTCMILTIFSESSRKVMKTILQIVFKNKIHTMLEIGMLTTYVCVVWGAYLFGYPISLPLLFGTLCSVSLAATCATALSIISWYQLLPNESAIQDYSHWRIFKSRLFGYLHHMNGVVFSTNFIVPLFAYEFGLQYAGILRFVSNITHNITSIIHRVFGASGNALLAHTRDKTFTTQQELFGQLTSKLNQALYALGIFFIINYKILLGMSNAPINYVSIAFFALCFIMQITESFGLAFEKLFLAYERAELLFLVSALATISALGLTVFATQLDPLTLLFIFALVRTLALVLLHGLALYSWKLRAHWSMQLPYFLGTLIVSLAFFFMFR